MPSNPNAIVALGGAIATTSCTLDGQFVGSLPWASPEQAAGDQANIDIRTDVYSLGVGFYQLLSGGRFPYEVAGLSHKVRERIETAIPEPLRRASRTVASDLRVGRSTAGETPTLPIDAEIESIVMKCLAKDRNARYRSASDVAADIRRFLAHEAVSAMGGATTYIMGKWVRRHWVSVAALALVLLTFTVASVAVVAQLQTARRAEAKTLAALDKIALLTQDLEQQNRDTMRAASTWVPLVLDLMLQGKNAGTQQPDSAAGERLREMVRREIEKQQQLGLSPDSEATLRRFAAAIFQQAGLWSDAENELKLSLEMKRNTRGEDSQDAAAAQANLGLFYLDQGRYQDALPLLVSAVKTLRSTGQSKLDYLDLASALDNLGRTFANLGQSTKARESLDEALVLRRRYEQPADPSVGASLNNQAAAAYQSGDFLAAEQFARDAVKIFRQIEPQGQNMAIALSNLGMAMQARKKPTAEGALREVLEMFRRELGDDSIQVAIARNNLGVQVLNRGDVEAAEKMFRDALKALSADAAGRQYVPNVQAGLARALIKKGELDEAEQNLHAAESTLFSENAPLVARRKFCQIMIELAEARHRAGLESKADEAASMWRQRLEAINNENR